MAVRNTRRRQRGAGLLNIFGFGQKEASASVNSAGSINSTGSTNSTQKKSLLNRVKNWGKKLFVKESPLSTSTKPATSTGKPLVPLKEVVVSPGPSPAVAQQPLSAQPSAGPVVAVSPGESPNPATALTMATPPGSASSGPLKVSVLPSGLQQNAVQVQTPSPAPGMPPTLTALGGRRKNKRKQSKCGQTRRNRKQSRRKQSRRK